MTVLGSDWSHWNEHPNADPYEFIFHKATQGDYQVDSRYAERASWIRDMGKVWGAYHFPDVNVPVGKQIRYFYDHANIQPGDVVALDFENDGHWYAYTKAFLANFGKMCMAELFIRYPNNRVILYCNRDAYATIVQPYNVPIGAGLWIASPGTAPTMPWLFWQYGNGSVDYDRANFTDLDALKLWCHFDTAPDTRKQQQLLLNG
jgi:GH25 family lysozyme M1 (1,4-beta-N-acetylmuramidase)